jgi:hypothetical protein
MIIDKFVPIRAVAANERLINRIEAIIRSAIVGHRDAISGRLWLHFGHKNGIVPTRIL